jgi:hypothetical protein
MHVPRPGVFLRSALAISLAGLMAGISCDQWFDPCPKDEDALYGTDFTDKHFMSGTWTLSTVDGKSLPYSLPAGAGTLTAANIDFNTLYLDGGTCGNPTKSRGQIVALYHVLNNGVDKRDTQAGSFEFDNASNAVTLRALGYSIVGSAALNIFSSTMDVVAPIPVPLLGDIDYHLHFTR